MNKVSYGFGFISDSIFNFLRRKVRRLQKRFGKKTMTSTVNRNAKQQKTLSGVLISRSMISPLAWAKALFSPTQVKRVYTFRKDGEGEIVRLRLPSSVYDVWFINHHLTMVYSEDEVV